MIYEPPVDGPPSHWGVACTCREPTQLVIAFVAHHIALGAREIWLFLDETQPDLEALLTQIPQVKMQVCDAAYWTSTKGRRPRAIEPRQIANLDFAYNQTELPWLVHLDADEFLHADLPIAEILDALPEAVDYITFMPRERAFEQGVIQQDLFDGVFRQPIPRTWAGAQSLFAGSEEFLRRGVLGHAIGKSMMRTGRPLLPGIHTPRRPRAYRNVPFEAWDIQRARLLHFDGLTALHWSAKLLRAAIAQDQRRGEAKSGVPDHRNNQITRMQGLGANIENAWSMHETLKTIRDVQMKRLRALALIEDYALTIEQDIQALGLDREIDLSREAFDAALAALQPQISEWYVPWQKMLLKKTKQAAKA